MLKSPSESIEFMADLAGGTKAEFQAQLKTTAMYFKASDAVTFAQSDELKKTMDYVRQFSFDKGQFGAGAGSPDFIERGIARRNPL